MTSIRLLAFLLLISSHLYSQGSMPNTTKQNQLSYVPASQEIAPANKTTLYLHYSEKSDNPNAWMSIVWKEYVLFKLSLFDEIEIFTSPEGQATDFTEVSPTQELSEQEIIERGQSKQCMYSLLLTDSVSQNITLSCALFSSKTKKKVFSQTTTFSQTQANKTLNESLLSMLRFLKISVTHDLLESFCQNPLSDREESLLEFSQIITKLHSDPHSETMIDNLKTLYDIEPQFSLVASILAHVSQKNNNYEETSLYLSKLIEQHGYHFPKLYAEAIKNFRLSKSYKRAQDLITLAHSHSVHSPDFQTEESLIEYRGNYPESASHLLKKALSRDMNDGEALEFLIRSYIKNKEDQKALNLIQRLLDQDTKKPFLFAQKTQILLKTKQLSDAKECITSGLNLFPRDSSLIMLYGEVHFAAGEYDAAISKYNQLLERSPENHFLILKISEAYRLGNNPNFAMDVLKKYSTAFSTDDVSYKKQLGLVSFSLGDTTKALDLLQSISIGETIDTNLMYALIELNIKNKNLEQASLMIQKAKVSVSDRQRLSIYTIEIDLQEKRFVEAKQKLLVLFNENPFHPRVNIYLGDVYSAMSNFPKALEHYCKQRSIDPSNESLPNTICQLYYKTGNLIKAEKEALDLIANNTDNPAAYTILFQIALKKKDPEQASLYLGKIQKTSSVDPTVYKQLGSLFTTSGQKEKAIEFYGLYLEKNAEDLQVLMQVSQLYLQTNQDSLFAETCIKIYEQNPFNGKSYLTQAGHTFFNKGFQKNASSAYQTYIEEFGCIDDQITFNYASLEFEQKKYEHVIELIKSIKNKTVYLLKTTPLLANSYFETSRYKEAIPLLSAWLKREPKNADIAEKLVAAFLQEGFIDRALSLYQQYPSIDGGEKLQECLFIRAQNIEKTNVKQAISLYLQNIKLYPEDIRNFERLSQVYRSLQMYDAALETIKKAIALSSTCSPCYRQQAELFLLRGEKLPAANAFEYYYSLQPADTTIPYRLGMLYYQLGSYDKAIPHLSKAAERSPNNNALLKALGISYARTGAYAKASVLFRQVLQNNPHDNTIILMLTHCYQETKDSANLIKLMHTRVQMEPKNVRLCQEYGLMLSKKGDTVQAIAFLEKASILKPQDLSIHKNLIDLYKNDSTITIRMSHINKALSLSPKDADLYFQRAVSFFQLKNYSSAKKDLQKSLNINPSNDIGRLYYGNIFLNERNYSEAMACFQAAIKLKPSTIDYYVQLAIAASKNNEPKKAIYVIDQALAIQPENAQLLQMAGSLYYSIKNYDMARQYLSVVLEKNKNCFECNKLTGFIYYQDEKYAESIKYLKPAFDQAGMDDSLLVLLANAYLKKNEPKKALELYENAYARNPLSDKCLYLLCSQLLQNGNSQDAENYVKNSKVPKKSGYRILLEAKLYETAGKKELAAQYYESALRLMPNNSDALLGRGKSRLLAKEYLNALKDFNKIIAQNPSDEQALLNVGKAYFGLNNYRAAKQIFKEIIAKNSQVAVAYHYLGMTLMQLDKHKEAVSILETGVELDKKNSTMYYILGVSYEKLKRYEEAIERFKDAAKYDKSKQLVCFERIGILYLSKLNKDEDAKKYFKKYLNAGGNNPKIKKFMQQKSEVAILN